MSLSAIRASMELTSTRFSTRQADMKPTDEAMGALAEYYTRANLMYAHVEDLLERADDDFQYLVDQGVWIYFKAYFSLWLAALFVTVEGYRRLKLSDPTVAKLTDRRMKFLKQFRDEAFHFSVEQELSVNLIENVDWAHDLHEAIGDALRAHFKKASGLDESAIAQPTVTSPQAKKRKRAVATKRPRSK